MAKKRKRGMVAEGEGDFAKISPSATPGEVVSWRSEQDKYWGRPRTVRKFAEDLSLSDYREAAKVHPDQRQRERFKTVAGWMKKQGANADVRLGSLL